MAIVDKHIAHLEKQYRELQEREKQRKAQLANIIVIERPVYHTAREYICKFPAKIMKYLPHQKGDTVRFILDKSKGEPRLILEYVRKK